MKIMKGGKSGHHENSIEDNYFGLRIIHKSYAPLVPQRLYYYWLSECSNRKGEKSLDVKATDDATM